MLTRFFARRYLFSPKSRSVINVIAGVSVLSFAMPVAAMIVLLSVLNGFGDFAKSMSSAFDADLTVAPREGQTFASAEIDSLALTRVKGVGVVSYLLEQQVLLERDGLQTMATLRGVDDRYTEVFPIEETIPLASNTALSLLGEMQHLGKIPLAELLTWAAPNGARALGFSELGEVAAGKRPGLAVLSGLDYDSMTLTPASCIARIL